MCFGGVCKGVETADEVSLGKGKVGLDAVHEPLESLIYLHGNNGNIELAAYIVARHRNIASH